MQYAIRALVPPGYIKALHTDLPIATHNIGTNGTLIDNVHFGELNLQTANARISSGVSETVLSNHLARITVLCSMSLPNVHQYGR